MSQLKIAIGTQLCFADHAGDFTAPTAANDLRVGSPTSVQLTLENLTAAAARQSAKFDTLSLRPQRLSFAAAIESFSNPTTGGTIDFYVGWSPISTAASGNPGGCSGSDAAYVGGASMSLAEGLAQLDRVGSLIVGAGTLVQMAHIGIVVPRFRYGILVVVNNTSIALAATDGNETHVIAEPMLDDLQ